ncbi:MAG: hypothetical protein ACRDNF_26550 [Streptosporangiaceae bacterium]
MVRYELTGTGADLPPDIQLTVFRLIQEALTNTMKHAGPGASAAVRLELTPADVRIEVQDDYVYAGLRAGASGFLLKDTQPDDLVAAIRTVASGDAVLAPGATRRLIHQFTAQQPEQPSGRRAEQIRAALTGREEDARRVRRRSGPAGEHDPGGRAAGSIGRRASQRIGQDAEGRSVAGHVAARAGRVSGPGGPRRAVPADPALAGRRPGRITVPSPGCRHHRDPVRRGCRDPAA